MLGAFRTSQPLRDLFQKFVGTPRITFEATDKEVERSNFASWYNALSLREYENPAVNDLYYLHEITHISSMPYSPNVDFQTWKQKMFLNESEASVMSEAFIYYLCPGLRPLSFKNEIWVDRFLKEETRNGDLDFFSQKLTRERDRAQARPNREDPQEARIADYQLQNEAWAEIWRANYEVIEKHMSRFTDEAKADKRAAGRKHLAWMNEQIALSGQPFPFAKEVEEFAAYCAKDKTYMFKELNLKK